MNLFDHDEDKAEDLWETPGKDAHSVAVSECYGRRSYSLDFNAVAVASGCTGEQVTCVVERVLEALHKIAVCDEHTGTAVLKT